MKFLFTGSVLFLSLSAFSFDSNIEEGFYISPDNSSCSATVSEGRNKLAVSLRCASAHGTFVAREVGRDFYRYCESSAYCYNFEIVSSTSFIAYGTRNGSVIGNKLLYIKE